MAICKNNVMTIE